MRKLMIALGATVVLALAGCGASHPTTAAQVAAGQRAVAQWVKGMAQYKVTVEPDLFQEGLTAIMKKLSPQAQAGAAQSVFAFAEELQKQGRLAGGTPQDFAAQIEERFPGLIRYVGTSATAGDGGL